jgi:hypothetical protein
MWMLDFSKNQMTIYAIRYTKSFTLSKRLNFKNINMVNKKQFFKMELKNSSGT